MCDNQLASTTSDEIEKHGMESAHHHYAAAAGCCSQRVRPSCMHINHDDTCLRSMHGIIGVGRLNTKHIVIEKS